MNLLISFDQAGNTLLGGAPDETISSRLARSKTRGEWLGWLGCVALNWLDPGHCEAAIRSERERGQLPPELRE